MTNTSTKLPVRVRAFLQLTAAALFLIAVVPGCGSSDNKSGSGGGGSAGSTGNDSGGAGTTSTGGQSSAGTTSAGNAGNSSGGSANGGSSMVGEAGSAEAGAPGAVCGNGILEPGEECDDGNTKDEDGCSSICTNKCEQCEAAANCFTKYDLSQPCTTPAACRNRDNEALSFDLCYGTTGAGQTPASGGPAAGTLKSTLCQKVVACIRKSNCVSENFDFPLTSCYCGDGVALDACETAPKGPCAEELADAAEARSFSTLQLAWSAADPTTTAGAVANIILNCDESACPSECFQDKTPTTCSRCAIGSNAHDFNLLCPDYTGCYFGADFRIVNADGSTKTLPAAQLCTAAVECALRTGCGASADGAEKCYGAGTGPCAAEFAAAADSTDPLTVLSRIENSDDTTSAYPASVAQSLLQCDAANCATTCFPSGTGGGGSAGAGGGASAGTGGASGGTAGASGGTAGASGGTAGASGGTAGASAGTGGLSGA